MAVHTYRYYVNDLLTNNPAAELPLYGVFMSKQINDAGTFNGTLKLGTGWFPDASLIDSTMPGRSAMYVERDGVLVWGGIIWSRTYASESKTLQYYAQTFESYFDHVCIDANFIMDGVEQTTILTNLVNQLQGQTGTNIGLTLASMPTTGINRKVLIPGYEYHYGKEVIDQLVGVDNGIEMTIDIAASATQDKPTKTIRVGYPALGNPVATSGLYYDYPGTIDRYWWSESGANGAVNAVALGNGSGFEMVRSVAQNGDKIAAGWPAWWVVNSHKNIADIDGIAAAAREDLAKYDIPYSRPTFEISNTAADMFSSWNNLGDALTVRIEDARFPNGKVISSRMLGWELSPAEGETEENLKLIIEGDEGAT